MTKEQVLKDLFNQELIETKRSESVKETAINKAFSCGYALACKHAQSLVELIALPKLEVEHGK